ncbi:MAG: hypothetical protein ACREDH_07705 [Methylocella sp.]
MTEGHFRVLAHLGHPYVLQGGLGLRLDAYQLLPLRKALRLPRINLVIADAPGVVKTVSAGVVARELLIARASNFVPDRFHRHRRPTSDDDRRKDGLEAKFGLSFEIIAGTG